MRYLQAEDALYWSGVAQFEMEISAPLAIP